MHNHICTYICIYIILLLLLLGHLMWFAQPHIGLHNPTAGLPTSIALALPRKECLPHAALSATNKAQHQVRKNTVKQQAIRSHFGSSVAEAPPAVARTWTLSR